MAKSVLIVDDDPSVVELLVSIMNMLGVETRIAPNGRDALAAIQATPPDAVILDLMMPVMDGFTMLSQLRKEEKGQKMPVIILSALADQKGAVDRLPGIVGTITKGRFSLMELREMLGKAGVLIDPTNVVGKPALPPEKPDVKPTLVLPPAQPSGAPAAQPKSDAPATEIPSAQPTAQPDAPAVAAPPTALPEDTQPTPPLGVKRPNGHPGNGDGGKTPTL